MNVLQRSIPDRLIGPSIDFLFSAQDAELMGWEIDSEEHTVLLTKRNC